MDDAEITPEAVESAAPESAEAIQIEEEASSESWEAALEYAPELPTQSDR